MESPISTGFQEHFFQSLKSNRKPNKDLSEKLVMVLATVMLDLSDFHIYTRMFLDVITICIKHSFRSAGNRNWQLMKNSVRCLLKHKQLQKYKTKIAFDFFDGLEEKVDWMHGFKESRDRLIHHKSHLGLSTTIDGKLGYDVVDVGDESWGRDTVIEIFKGIEDIIDNLSDLMEYLSENLPRIQRAEN